MKWRQTYIPGLNVTFQNFKTIELSKIIKKKANSDSIEINKEEFSGIADCEKQNQTYKQLIEVLGVSLLPSSEIVKEFENSKSSMNSSKPVTITERSIWFLVEWNIAHAMKYWNKHLIDNWRTELVSAKFGLSIEQIKQIKKIAFDPGHRAWYSKKPKKEKKDRKITENHIEKLRQYLKST